MTLLVKENEATPELWRRRVRDAINQLIGYVDPIQTRFPSSGALVFPIATASSVSPPTPGNTAIFVDSATGKLSRKDSAGTVTAIG